MYFVQSNQITEPQSHSGGKGPQEVSGTTTRPEQGQLWNKTRLLRAFSKQVSRLFSTELFFFSHSTCSLHWYKSTIHPRCRTSHLPLLNFIRLLVTHSWSLPRCFSVAALSLSVSVAFCGLVVSSDLGRVHSVSYFRSLIEILDRIYSRIRFWRNSTGNWPPAITL